MLNFQYIGNAENYSVSFNNIDKNVVEVIGDIPKMETGFILTRIGNPSAFKGDYSDFKTVYREIEGGFQFSNDGSVFVPVVQFFATDGGSLNGETMQTAENYKDLIIPTPEASENYEFVEWVPGIPKIGKIDDNKSFTAIFKSTVEPETTLEERMTVIEGDISKINNALGGV